MTPRNSPPRWTPVALAWTVFGLVYGLLTKFGPGATATWATAMLPTTGAAMFWLAATPLLTATARRIRAAQQPWWVRAALHVVPCALMVLGTAAVMWGIRALLVPAWGSFRVRVLLTADLSVFQYVAVVILAHAWDRHLALAQHERRDLVLEQQLVGARLLYLERQLRPHFLFNCLNAIAEMAHVSPRSAAHMISSLRRLLTSAVQTAGRTEVPLSDELATLDAYLELQRARFMGSIDVEQVVSDDARSAGVPPLLLQPVVENAIQHGLDRVDGRSLVRIVIAVRGEQLHIEVEDNGTAGSSTASRGFGIGLRNTRERIETLYGEQGCSLELELRPTGGAVTRIQIPLVHVTTSEPTGWTVDGLPAVLDPEPEESAAVASEAPASIRTRLPIVLLVCALVPLGWSTQIWLLFIVLGRTAQFELSGPDMVAGAAWMLLAPFALYLAERFPLRGPHLRRHLALHLALAVAASLIEGVIVTSTGLQGNRPILAAQNAPQRILGVLAWLSLVGWTQVDVFARWYHERGVVSARLRAAIERARWRAATLELQPDLVLAALNAAERQVLVSVEDAENTLYELSEVLRSQLDLSRHTLVPLEMEARQIAATQRLRTLLGGGGPRVNVTVAPQLGAVQVPSGVLRRFVQETSAKVSGSPDVEVRLEGIRYLRQQMEMRLSVQVNGAAATGDDGHVTVLTDLSPLDASGGTGTYPDALRSGERPSGSALEVVR